MEELSKENSQELSNIFNLSIESFKELENNQLDLNALFLLECINEGTDPTIHIDSFRLKSWKQTLIRRKLIHSDNRLTPEALNLLDSIRMNKTLKEVIEVKKEAIIDDFERWWKAYPSTDFFVHKGKEFPGSRGMKVTKGKCKKLFEEIINEGKYDASDMIRALEYEILMKKEVSCGTNKNCMTYMQNSHTYLYQKTYENFMEISKIVTKNNSSLDQAFGI